MKIEEKLKVILVILVIILISLISFGGIYFQKTKFVESVIPEYQLGMDLKGGRLIGLVVDDSNKTVIYDKDGKVVEKEGEGTTKKEIPVNPEEVLTTQNYKQVKEIIEKRLKAMNVANYTIRQDEKTGKLYIQIPENANTDLVAQYMAIKGEFSVTNEAGDVLLNNSHIEKAQVGYNNATEGTTVYLTIHLNKEGTQIFKDITNTYVKTTDEEGKETTKNITLKIDDSTLLTTYFESEISNGVLQLSMGGANTDNNEIQSYVKEASNIAVLLNSGKSPVTYKMEENRYVVSDITTEMFYIPVIIVGVLIAIGIIFLILKYRKNGFFASISLIGYIAALLLVIRYTNVALTIEGMIGIVIAIMMNYIFTVYLLNLIKAKESKTKQEAAFAFKEALLKTLFVFIPVSVTAVVMCFAGWLPIYSFGMVMFWGVLLIVLYNLLLTRTLIVDTTKNK